MPVLVAYANRQGRPVFFGATDPAARPICFAEHIVSPMPAATNAFPKGDFRDWVAIDAWADEVARDLTSTPVDGPPAV